MMAWLERVFDEAEETRFCRELDDDTEEVETSF